MLESINRVSFNKLQELAAEGDASAQFDLGFIYDTGEGASQNFEEAAKWYRKAAEQGYTDAEALLGGMYIVGRGVPQDDERGRLWSEKAARKGDHTALFVLGVIYESGLGVVPDYVIAHAYLNLADINGQSTGAERKKELEKKMTAEEVFQAQAIARRCVNSNYKNCI